MFRPQISRLINFRVRPSKYITRLAWRPQPIDLDVHEEPTEEKQLQCMELAIASEDSSLRIFSALGCS